MCSSSAFPASRFVKACLLCSGIVQAAIHHSNRVALIPLNFLLVVGLDSEVVQRPLYQTSWVEGRYGQSKPGICSCQFIILVPLGICASSEPYRYRIHLATPRCFLCSPSPKKSMDILSDRSFSSESHSPGGWYAATAHLTWLRLFGAEIPSLRLVVPRLQSDTTLRPSSHPVTLALCHSVHRPSSRRLCFEDSERTFNRAVWCSSCWSLCRHST